MRRPWHVLGAALACLLLAGLVLALLLRAPRLEVPEPGFRLGPATLVTPRISRVRVAAIAGDARIRTIEPASASDGALDDGPFVLPGLIDLHVHHPPAVAVGERTLFALLFLRHGVTGVRDMGAAVPRLLARHAEAIDAGRLAGPRTLHCGPFLDGPPPVWPGATVIETEDQGRAAVRAVAEAGHHCVKLYNELTPRVVRAMVDEAGRVGLPVVGHVPWGAALRHMGGVEVQHLMGLEWGLRGRALEQAIERYVAVSLDAGIPHTPTLVTFARLEQLRGPHRAVLEDPLARLLPGYHAALLWDPERNAMVAAQLSEPGRIDVMREAVSALWEAGVPIHAGTDTMNPLVVPGAGLLEEIRLLADAGLGPEAALAAATWRNAEALRVPDLGRLVRGAPADLLVFERDPTRDLAHLESLRAVVAGGRLYPIEALEAALERARRHFAGWPYDPLSRGIAERGLRWLGGSGG